MPPKDMNRSTSLERELPVLGPGQTIGSVNEIVSDAVLKRPIRQGLAAGRGDRVRHGQHAVHRGGLAAVSRASASGGINRPVMWGFAIINFVWWIGIGHAGTLISAILLLMKQDWRTSINRFAEAMTLFAVACAGMFPLLHMGRPWVFYWMGPYPNTMALWPQFRSPLVWDVFAVSTYASVSAPVLVRRPDPRPRHVPRPGQEQHCPDDLRRSGPWAGPVRLGTGSGTRRRT